MAEQGMALDIPIEAIQEMQIAAQEQLDSLPAGSAGRETALARIERLKLHELLAEKRAEERKDEEKEIAAYVSDLLSGNPVDFEGEASV